MIVCGLGITASHNPPEDNGIKIGIYDTNEREKYAFGCDVEPSVYFYKKQKPFCTKCGKEVDYNSKFCDCGSLAAEQGSILDLFLKKVKNPLLLKIGKFGYDVRVINFVDNINNKLMEELKILTSCILKSTKAEFVLIGSDNRPYKEKMLKIIESSVKKSGIDYNLLKKPVPTPLVKFSTVRCPRYKVNDIFKSYIEWLKETFFGFQGETKEIWVDCLNGIMGKYAKEIFSSFGFKFKYLNSNSVELKGKPDPGTDLGKKNIRHGKNGFAFDGDGDRVIFYSNGEFVSNTRLFGALVPFLRKKLKGNTFLYCPRADSNVINWIEKKYKIRGVLGDTGRTRLSMQAIDLGWKEGNILTWFEMSGHNGGFFESYSRKIVYAEIVYWALTVLECLQELGFKDINELIENYSVPSSIFLEEGVKIPPGKNYFVNKEAVNIAKDVYSDSIIQEIPVGGGLKIQFKDGGDGAIRASNTENKVRVYSNGSDINEAKRNIERLKRVLISSIKKLK